VPRQAGIRQWADAHALRRTESVADPSGAVHLADDTTGVPTCGSIAIKE
jgi:hypothetical protein